MIHQFNEFADLFRFVRIEIFFSRKVGGYTVCWYNILKKCCIHFTLAWHFHQTELIYFILVYYIESFIPLTKTTNFWSIYFITYHTHCKPIIFLSLFSQWHSPSSKAVTRKAITSVEVCVCALCAHFFLIINLKCVSLTPLHFETMHGISIRFWCRWNCA